MMPVNYWHRSGYTGGADGDLDNINGALLEDGHIAYVTTSSQFSVHRLDADSGATANSPFVIPPALNAGNKRWHMVAFVSRVPEEKTDDYTITVADLGKSLRMNAATAKTIYLPSVGASEDGARITLMKIGAGQVTVDAADSDTIWDSSAGGTIYNDVASETWALITLEYVHSAAKWVIVEIFGTWKTT